MPIAPSEPINQTINKALQQFAEEAVRSGIRYDFGSKNMETGGIDCSGFVATGVANVAYHLSQGLKLPNGQLISFEGGVGLARNFMTHSEDQIARMQQNGADVMGPSLGIEDIKGGMIIGMDHGRTSFDAGRARGIDHVVFTYEDENGRIMVAESASSKNGAHISSLDEWYSKNGHRPLFASKLTDMMDLEADPENPNNISLKFNNQTGYGRNIPGSGADAELFFAMSMGNMSAEDLQASLREMTQAEFQNSSLHNTSNRTVYNLQTTELQDYYPQPGTEGLSGAAARIAGDGVLGDITFHGSKLASDTDGSFAKESIKDLLQGSYMGDSELMKLDASLNRLANMDGASTEIVPVDGVFRTNDAERVSDFITQWRSENDGQVFEIGSAAAHKMLEAGLNVDGLAELTGMSPEVIQKMQDSLKLSDDLVTALAQNTSKMETGTTDLRAGSAQIAVDTGGSHSYGFMGVNSGVGSDAGSWSTSAGKFARMYPELGLTATPGSPEFDNQWQNAFATNLDHLVEAQLDYYNSEILDPARAKLSSLGLDRFANDPGVLNYVSDSIIQYGAGSTINSHLLAGANAQSPEQFLKAAAQAQISNIPQDFPTYLSGTGRGNEQGLVNRVNRRLASSLDVQDKFTQVMVASNEEKQPAADVQKTPEADVVATAQRSEAAKIVIADAKAASATRSLISDAHRAAARGTIVTGEPLQEDNTISYEVAVERDGSIPESGDLTTAHSQAANPVSIGKPDRDPTPSAPAPRIEPAPVPV